MSAPSPQTAAATAVAPVFSSSLPARRKTTKITPPSNNTSSSHVVRNSIIAGSLAGIASTCTFYPFEMLRTKMQSAAALETTTTATTSSTKTLVHRGPVQTLVNTISHGGVRALYTGMALPLTAQAIYKATVFSVNKVTTNALTEWKRQEQYKMGDFSSPITLDGKDRFVCGCVGGAINALLFVTPVEFVRNQLIAQHTRKAQGIVSPTPCFQGPRHVIAHTISSRGILGLWKGAAMAVSRDSFGCGCFFLTYYYISQRLSESQASSTLIAGAASGLAFWVAALPLDTLKTWVQNGSATSGRRAICDSIAEHGVLFTAKRLCRGYQVALGRGMPAAAVTITTYEAVSKYLDKLDF